MVRWGWPDACEFTPELEKKLPVSYGYHDQSVSIKDEAKWYRGFSRFRVRPFLRLKGE